MKIKFSFLLVLVIVILSSCSKEEGEGGTGTIRGKLMIRHLSGSMELDSVPYEGADVDVFILYGTDDQTYDDDFKTSFDGTYEFKYLQKGTYRLFAYTTDTTHFYQGYIEEDRPKLPVFKTVEITDKKQTVEVPDIVIIKYN